MLALNGEGNRVFLVDLGSRNGTSVNDPLKKIARGVIWGGRRRLPGDAQGHGQRTPGRIARGGTRFGGRAVNARKSKRRRLRTWACNASSPCPPRPQNRPTLFGLIPIGRLTPGPSASRSAAACILVAGSNILDISCRLEGRECRPAARPNRIRPRSTRNRPPFVASGREEMPFLS